VICLPADLPEYIEVDVSGLHLGYAIHISELTLPEGVESTTMTHGGDDLAIVTIAAVRGAKADEAEAKAEEAEEGEEASEEGGE
jgi:large subunit ribosomal protein L25